MTLPFPFNAVNTIGGALERVGLQPSLNPESLKHAAVKRTGLDDFGDPRFNDGLKALTASAKNDARLNTLGKITLRLSIIAQLSNRLKCIEAQRARPEIFASPLIAPVVVLGMARTGTTLLHRLIALDPRHRGVPAYEIFNPFPWTPREAKIKRLNRSIKLLMKASPEIVAKHAPDAEQPEECTGLMAPSFLSAGFWAQAPVYGYVDWILMQDESRTYDEYRSFLHLLQSVAPEKRLALKSPLHTPNVDKFHNALGGGLFIQTHRDPAEAIASLNSLAHSFHRLVALPDIERMAALHLKLQAEFIKRNMAVRERYPDLIYDVFYPELLADPKAVMRGVYERFDFEWRDETAARIDAYLAKNQQNKHGVHNYDAEEFGQSADEIRAAFKDYLAMFGDRLGL